MPSSVQLHDDGQSADFFYGDGFGEAFNCGSLSGFGSGQGGPTGYGDHDGYGDGKGTGRTSLGLGRGNADGSGDG